MELDEDGTEMKPIYWLTRSKTEEKLGSVGTHFSTPQVS